MLKLAEKIERITVSRPSTVYVDGGITLHIDSDNNVTIEGHKSLKFSCDGDLDFDAKNINLHASKSLNIDVNGDIHIGSSTNIVEQAPRIDLNPKELTSGYKGKKNAS